MKKYLLLAAVLAGVFAAIPAASAAVVCNSDGDCWRTRERYTYRPEWKLRIHSDNWKWRDRDRDHYRWREAGHGRGYWRNGVWIGF